MNQMIGQEILQTNFKFKTFRIGATNVVKNSDRKVWHLIVEVHGALIRIFLEML